eukprot:5030788-Amphidinium_carterae.1
MIPHGVPGGGAPSSSLEMPRASMEVAPQHLLKQPHAAEEPMVRNRSMIPLPQLGKLLDKNCGKSA